MYVELILRPQIMQGQRIYGDVARRLIAEALDGKDVDPILFSKGAVSLSDEDLPAQAPIVYDGGTGFLRIYGIGEAGAEALTKEMGVIHAAVSKRTNSPVYIEIKRGDVAYTNRGYRTYRIGVLGLAKMEKARGAKFYEIWKRYLNMPEDQRDAVFLEAVPMIKSVLDRGFEAVAVQNGIDLPKNLDIDITGGKLSIQGIHPDKGGTIGVVRGLRFIALGDFVGPWAVGHLRGYGYGIVRRDIVVPGREREVV